MGNTLLYSYKFRLAKYVEETFLHDFLVILYRVRFENIYIYILLHTATSINGICYHTSLYPKCSI